MRTALIFGASGQIGFPLVGKLHDAGWSVIAVSRARRVDQPGLRWQRGEFARLDGLPPRVDAVVSCGPLDLFSHWLASGEVETGRVVAFGSTSAQTKQDSGEDDERALARLLRESEERVLKTAQLRGVQVTLLQPTLVYGAGRDATLTRIASLARRWKRFPLPRDAGGLRQPVHVDDLAQAAFDALDATASYGRSYALPGGEALPYREMVRRVLDCLEPRPRLVELPAPLFRLALAAARAAGIASGFGPGALARLRADLVFDAAPARADFGYAPRPFRPVADMFRHED